MTSVSFSFSHEELADTQCKSLIDRAKRLKTIQYVIPPTKKLTNASALQCVEDIKSLGSHDVVISFGISINSFEKQSVHEVINYVKEILLATGSYRLNLDFTDFSASGGLTDSANQQPHQVFKKILTMIKTVQRDFEYSIFTSVSFTVSSYLLLLEQDLRLLSCFFTELINISMIQFTIRSSFKKSSESWGEFIIHCHSRLTSQFDGKYDNYFEFAQKPSFAYRVHYPINSYTISSFSDENLLDCIKVCEKKDIPALIIGLSKNNAKRFKKIMPDKFLEENLGSMNKELEVPLHMSLLSEDDQMQALEDSEYRTEAASETKKEQQATLPSYSDITGLESSSANTEPAEDTTDVETLSFPPSYSSVVVPTLKSLGVKLPSEEEPTSNEK